MSTVTEVRIVSSLPVWLILFLTAVGTVPAAAQTPLRLSESVEDVIDDLESFVPEYMREEDVPGVAVALVRDGKVVRTKGFGVANALTRRRVGPETVFEVASSSKVVTAYVALRLVDQGVLSLDEPLNSYLPEPWLPPSDSRDAITLRQVLSHSSGLGHATSSRQTLFAPGRGYSYSAIGFQYAQAVIEHVTGQGLDEVAEAMVFAPLAMSSSSFVNPEKLRGRSANGHLRAIVPTVLFVSCFVVSLILVVPLSLVALRFLSGRWRPSPRRAAGILGLAFVLALVPAFVLPQRIGLPEFSWWIAGCGFALTAALASASLAGRLAVVRWLPGRTGWRAALTVVWSLLVLAGLFFLAVQVRSLPVPRWPDVRAEAAGSMRATAGDLATFLAELSRPQRLTAETAAQLRTPQVRLSDDLSWGLGPGIHHSPQGDALWQWGQHLDFQSLMMIYPEHGFGVVVCTNSDFLNPDVALEIAYRALGGDPESVRRAIHLEHNYREGE